MGRCRLLGLDGPSLDRWRGVRFPREVLPETPLL